MRGEEERRREGKRGEEERGGEKRRGGDRREDGGEGEKEERGRGDHNLKCYYIVRTREGIHHGGITEHNGPG